VEKDDELAGGSARARLYPGTVKLCSQICLLMRQVWDDGLRIGSRRLTAR